MCGIIGITSNENVSASIIGALRKLDYRGYDSAGIAIHESDKIFQRKVKGKLDNLVKSLEFKKSDGKTGIGHTRWATHGKPSERNAHPHSSPYVSLVHNGIIENASDLKSLAELREYSFESETDSEVITALLSHYRKEGYTHIDCVKETISKLVGSYALAIIFSDQKEIIFGAKNGSPLVAGINDSGTSLGSDSIALSSLAEKVSYLEDGDIVIVDNHNIQIFDQQEKRVNREYVNLSISEDDTSKGTFNHFMEKEIHEQPRSVGDTLRQFIDYDNSIISNPDLKINWQKVNKVHLIACGTAYYSCMIAKYFFEQQYIVVKKVNKFNVFLAIKKALK